MTQHSCKTIADTLTYYEINTDYFLKHVLFKTCSAVMVAELATWSVAEFFLTCHHGAGGKYRVVSINWLLANIQIHYLLAVSVVF